MLLFFFFLNGLISIICYIWKVMLHQSSKIKKKKIVALKKRTKKVKEKEWKEKALSFVCCSFNTQAKEKKLKKVFSFFGGVLKMNENLNYKVILINNILLEHSLSFACANSGGWNFVRNFYSWYILCVTPTCFCRFQNHIVFQRDWNNFSKLDCS